MLRVLLGVRDSDAALAEFAATIERERLTGSTFWVRHWEQAGWLRPDITVERAADSLWAINSPQPRWLLLDRGWSESEFSAWLADLIHHAIFASPAGRG